MSIQTETTGTQGRREGRRGGDRERRVVIERVLDAPPALVWKVWTTPEHIERWWGHTDLHSADCAVDLTEGGTFRLNLVTSDATVHPCLGAIREIVPRRRLVFEGPARSDSACGAGIPPRALVTVTFEAIGDQTKLTIDTWFDTESACCAAAEAGYVEGWNDAVGRFAAELATL